MDAPDFTADLAELVSAEDFLDYFGIVYDPAVLHANRLHILQRFHNYIHGAGDVQDYGSWKSLLARAYEDFVHSDALTEGVFQVFKRARGIATVSIDSIQRRRT